MPTDVNTKSKAEMSVRSHSCQASPNSASSPSSSRSAYKLCSLTIPSKSLLRAERNLCIRALIGSITPRLMLPKQTTKGLSNCVNTQACRYIRLCSVRSSRRTRNMPWRRSVLIFSFASDRCKGRSLRTSGTTLLLRL